jgi:deoxyhypusine monooxygenase
VPSLVKVLEDTDEANMVRHEAAEALGGIATPEVLPYLKSWMNREDSPRVVRESCQVAIDMWEVCACSLSGDTKQLHCINPYFEYFLV